MHPQQLRSGKSPTAEDVYTVQVLRVLGPSPMPASKQGCYVRVKNAMRQASVAWLAQGRRKGCSVQVKDAMKQVKHSVKHAAHKVHHVGHKITHPNENN